VASNVAELAESQTFGSTFEAVRNTGQLSIVYIHLVLYFFCWWDFFLRCEALVDIYPYKK